MDHLSTLQAHLRYRQRQGGASPSGSFAAGDDAGNGLSRYLASTSEISGSVRVARLLPVALRPEVTLVTACLSTLPAHLRYRAASGRGVSSRQLCGTGTGPQQQGSSWTCGEERNALRPAPGAGRRHPALTLPNHRRLRTPNSELRKNSGRASVQRLDRLLQPAQRQWKHPVLDQLARDLH